jgi:hypothetical protein
MAVCLNLVRDIRLTNRRSVVLLRWLQVPEIKIIKNDFLVSNKITFQHQLRIAGQERRRIVY